MKDFINKLELAFDKQLTDKTNYGRNQVKELFLRACIEVLAEKPEYIGEASDFEHIQKAGRINRVNWSSYKDAMLNTKSLSDKLVNRVSETPSKEEGEESLVHHIPRPKHKKFIDPVTEELIEANFYRQPDCKAWGIDFVNADEDMPVITGETNLDNPSIDDLLQLYYFYKEQIPF